LTGYRLRITNQAEADLVELFEFIAARDSVEAAWHVLDELEKRILGLDEQPERGNYLPELLEHGIKDFREVHFKPYRVIYEVIDKQVIVLACLDGRRNMQGLLERRLWRKSS
jgi:toxin ParE1/3/4